MANIKRLIELGMPTELAKEVAAQIDEAAAPQDASEVAFSSADFTATDVAAALQELYDAANP